VFIGFVIQIPVAASNEGSHFSTPAARVANIFFFFTIESNLIVGITTLLLTLRPQRSSTVFRVFWLAGLLGITVTGLVYHTVLAGLQTLHGWALAADLIFHTAVPIVAVLGWLLFGPRGLASWRAAGWALLYPIIWLAVTLIRGPIVDWYPYPFVDVTEHGLARVLLNSLGVAALFVALTAGVIWLDRWLTARRPAPRPSG
jgi:hypothetical protein